VKKGAWFLALAAAAFVGGCAPSTDTSKIEKLEKEVAELRSEIATIRTDVAANKPTDIFELPAETKDNLEAEKEFSPDDSSSSSVSDDQPAVTRMVVGSRNSDKFHYPSCRAANRINESNMVVYDSASEAMSAGRVPCKICGP
jgi:outer membrane murein-binding lipoprotein Lpp